MLLVEEKKKKKKNQTIVYGLRAVNLKPPRAFVLERKEKKVEMRKGCEKFQC